MIKYIIWVIVLLLILIGGVTYAATVLPVFQGGTGVSTFETDRLLVGNGSGPILTSGVVVSSDTITTGIWNGTAINTTYILDGTIQGADIEQQNTWTDNDILTFDSASDGFTGLTCAEITGSADLCDGSDATGAGGPTLHVDGGGFVFPQGGDFHKSPYYQATSTTPSLFVGGFLSQATSTFTDDLNTTSNGTTTFLNRVFMSTSTPFEASALTIAPAVSTDQALIIRGVVGQSVNLVTIENVAGKDLFNIESNGSVDIFHTASANGEHGLEIDCNDAGFSDVKCLDMDIVTGALASGEDEEGIFIQIDGSSATGGTFAGIEILSVASSATIYGIEFGTSVNPFIQFSGTLIDMSLASTTASGDITASATSTTSDATLWASDNDVLQIEDVAQFEEIEFIFDTFASQDLKFKFEFTTGASSYTEFGLTDGTQGAKQNGDMVWLLSDISGTWATNSRGFYGIQITRQRNNVVTNAIEDIIQISSVTELSLDKNGDLIIATISLEAAGVKISGDGDGAITFLGLGNGSDEDLTLNLDDTANTGVWSSSTGLNKLQFGSIGLTSTGNVDFSSGSLQIPNGTAPQTNVAGQIAIDTNDNELQFFGDATTTISGKYFITKTLDTPLDADVWLIYKARDNITITDIFCITDPTDTTGEDQDIDIRETDANGDSGITVDAVIVCTSTGAEDDGTLSNGTIDALDWIQLDVGVASGTIPVTTVTVWYTIDDQ